MFSLLRVPFRAPPNIPIRQVATRFSEVVCAPPITPTSANTGPLSARRVRLAEPEQATNNKTSLLKYLIGTYSDNVVNRVTPLVDWSSATPLTKREITLVCRAAQEAQQYPAPRTSDMGLAYFGPANRLNPGQVQGQGVMHTTERAHWLQASQPRDIICKPIAPSVAARYALFGIRDTQLGNLMGRNIATLEAAHALGLKNLVPETHAGNGPNGPAVYMEAIRGIPVMNSQPENRFNLSVPLNKSDISIELSGWNQKLAQLGLEITAYDEQLVTLQMKDAPNTCHCTFSQDAKGHMNDGTLNLKLTQLAWLDVICGQTDRHFSNIIVNYDQDGAVSDVVGIDNDMCFGEGVGAYTVQSPISKEYMGHHLPYRGLPTIVDSNTAKAILDLASEPRRTQYVDMLKANGLSNAECARALSRLDAASQRIQMWQKAEGPSVARKPTLTTITVMGNKVDNILRDLRSRTALTVGDLKRLNDAHRAACARLRNEANTGPAVARARDELHASNRVAARIHSTLLNMQIDIGLHHKQPTPAALDNLAKELLRWHQLAEATAAVIDDIHATANAKRHIHPSNPESWNKLEGPYSAVFSSTPPEGLEDGRSRAVFPADIRAALQPQITGGYQATLV